MKKIFGKTFSATLLLIISACNNTPVDEDEFNNSKYYNPVIAHNCADPSVIDDRDRTGYFYSYSTQNGTSGASDCVYLPIYRSKDLVTWEYIADAFGEDRPQWREDSRMWAPDINYINGKYILYYAAGLWDAPQWSASGVAVSNSPTGPFEDQGMLIGYENTGVKNSIDPNFIDTGEGKYLFWGSFGANSGIWAIELTNDGLAIKAGAKKTFIGANNMEGVYIHKHSNGYYYAFTSKGLCCEGKESTYHIVVARSKNILGPYVSPAGEPLTNEGYSYTILQSSEDKLFTGTGHNAEIITDDSGQDWMPYHAYWAENGYNGRCMNIDKVFWDENGWPYFKGKTSSSSDESPKWTK
ncbi:arabinan endo-1,5-alpha-L-arabinosidase [Mariniphaga anaerophila]|uniref:Arabinan endo-1,5-alpha-L-arabinosidase n=1 Tax=Mariniphaga anaerophila TaxID=1484053 RepID=A0A1M4WJ77_9BACT|nr:family 43 glycosylhydrolase [Mariniphaga anaerophila]SHE81266.1 arabinan endo-1,5-alpha-L-arabinosidase [Mariniphaga anaerophila]